MILNMATADFEKGRAIPDKRSWEDLVSTNDTVF